MLTPGYAFSSAVFDGWCSLKRDYDSDSDSSCEVGSSLSRTTGVSVVTVGSAFVGIAVMFEDSTLVPSR